MSRQVAKIALVTIDGVGVPANPDGTELELGGRDREAVAADNNPNAGFEVTPKASKLTLQPTARADFDPIELGDKEGAEIVIEYDNGAKFKIANAFCSESGTKGGGDTHWSFVFMGDPAEVV